MLCGSYAQGSTSSMAEEGSVFELERFQKQLESLLSRYPSDELQADSKPFCSDFCKLVEEYTSHWQVPLPQLRILEMALCYFVRASSFFSSNCDHVLHTLSSLALSVFELLLFFDQKDFHQDPLKHFTVTFQECHLAIAKHQNVHFHQVKNLVQGGGPWASSALQAILAESNLPQNEVDGYISSELPVFFELRVRYLFACERVSEAVALAKCCARHPTAGQHLFFLQVYLTWLYKTSQHDHLLKEVADLNGKDAVHIICSLESEEKDEVLLALSRAFLSQQLCRGDMYYLWDLVLIWSKLHSRLSTSKQAFLEEGHQLMLSATNVNSIFPFIRVILEELDEDGFQFCVELCANALQSCLPCDVVTKSLIYKTIASLLPNDLEVCRACALLVFFLERTVEAYKMVYLLYTHPDQEYHAETSPIGNHVRFETLQVLKKGLYFDPEFWNLIALRTNCLKLMSEKVVSAALEEIMEEKWVPNYCTKEPTFRSNPCTTNCQKGAKVAQQAGSKKRNHKEDIHHKEDKNHMAPKRIKMCPGKTQMSDHGAKKKGNQGSRSMKETSSESFRRSFWQLDKRQENVALQCSYGEHRRITRLSEKNPPKRKIRKPRWLMEDSGTLEENNAPPKVKKHVMKPQHQKQNRTAVVKRSTSGQVKNNAKHKTSVNSHLKAKENVAKHQKGFSVGCLKPPSPAHVILELSQPENELMGTFTEDTCNRQRGYPQMLLYKPTVKLPFTMQPVKTVHRKEVVLRARDTSTFVQQLHCYARRQKGKGVSNIQASVSTITRSSVQGSSPRVPSGELCEKPVVEMKVTIASQTQAGSEVTQSPSLDKVSQAQSQTIEKVSEPIPSAAVSQNIAVDSISEMVVNNDVSPLTQCPVLGMVSQAQPAEELSQTTPSAEVSQNLSADSMFEMVATNNISALTQSPVLDMVSQAQTTVGVSETTPSAQPSQNSIADTISQMVPTDDIPPILTAERISNIGAVVQIGSESWDDIARHEESPVDGNSGQKLSLFSIPPESGKNPLAQSTANTPNAFVTIVSTSGNLTETMAYTTPNDTKQSKITANSSTIESAVLEISAKKSKEPMPCKDSVRMDTDTITIQKETIPVENSGILSETSEAEATCVPKEMHSKEDLCALTLVTEVVTELGPEAFVQDTECPKEPIKEDSASEEVTPVLESKPDVPSEILTTSSCSVTEQGATVIADIQDEGGSEGIAVEMSVNGDPMATPQESEESKLEYCCTLCNKVFKGKRVIVHAMVHYRRDKCMFCGMLFKDDLLAMMHLSEHIEKLKKSREPASNKGQENCISESQEICTPRTSTKAETTNSSTVHHRGRPRKSGARPKCLNLSDSSPSESRIQLRSSRNPVDIEINKKEQNMSVCSTSKSRVHKVNGHIGKTQGVLMRDKQDTLNFETMEGLTQEISCQERGNDEAEKLLLPETGDLEGGASTTPIQIENKLICFTEDKIEKTESFKALKNDTKQDKRAAEENTVETQKKVCCPVNGCAWYSDLSRNRVALLYHALEDHYGDVKPLELAFRIGNSKCGVCMRVLWSFQHYQHHVERHRLTPRHPCLHQGCSARFKTGIEMRRHTRRHSPLQAVCCLPGCSQLFICLWALNLHEREHYASKPTQTVKEAIFQMGNKGNNIQVVKKQGRKPKDGTAVMPVNTVNCNQSIKGSNKLGNPVMGAPVTTATTALVTEALKLRNQPKNSNVTKNHPNKGPSAHPTVTARRFRQKLRKEQLTKKSLSIPKTRKVLSSIVTTNGNVRNRLKKKQVKVNLKGHKTKGYPPGSAKLKNALCEDKADINQKDDTAEEKTDLLKGQNSHTPAQRPSSPSETKRASKVSSEPKTEEEKSQQIQDLVKTTCTDSILELRESKSKLSPKKQIKKNHVKHKDVSESILMPTDTGNSLHELAPQPTTSAEETQKIAAKGNTKKPHVTKKCCVGKERNTTTAPVNSSKTQKKHKVKDPGTQSTSKKPKSKTTVQQGNPSQAKTTVESPAGDVKEETPPSIVTNPGDSVVENGQEVGIATPLDASKANKKLKVNNKTGDPKVVKKKGPSKDPGIPSTSKKPVKSKTVVPQFKPGEAKMVVEESVGDVGEAKGETPDPAISHGDSLLENGQVGNITAPLDASKANKKHKVRSTTGDPKIVKKKRPSKDPGTPSASKKPKSKTAVQQGKPGVAKTTVEGPACEVGKAKKETSPSTGTSPGDSAVENGQVAGKTTPFNASKANKKHKVRNTTGDPKIVKKKHPSKDPGTPSISKKHEPKTTVQQVEPSEAKAVIAEGPAGEVGKEQVEPPPSTMASPGYSVIENGHIGDIKEPQKPQVRVANVEDEKAKPAPTDCHLPYGKRPYIRLPPTAYLDEKFTTMPKRRKEMSMFFHSSEDNLSSQQASAIAPPQRQRCANCFVTFSSAAELQTHLQLKKCSNLFGFDSDDEGN